MYHNVHINGLCNVILLFMLLENDKNQTIFKILSQNCLILMSYRITWNYFQCSYKKRVYNVVKNQKHSINIIFLKHIRLKTETKKHYEEGSREVGQGGTVHIIATERLVLCIWALCVFCWRRFRIKLGCIMQSISIKSPFIRNYL